MPTQLDLVKFTDCAERLINEADGAHTVISGAVTRITNMVAGVNANDSEFVAAIEKETGTILTALGALTDVRVALVSEITAAGGSAVWDAPGDDGYPVFRPVTVDSPAPYAPARSDYPVFAPIQ